MYISTFPRILEYMHKTYGWHATSAGDSNTEWIKAVHYLCISLNAFLMKKGLLATTISAIVTSQLSQLHLAMRLNCLCILLSGEITDVFGFLEFLKQPIVVIFLTELKCLLFIKIWWIQNCSTCKKCWYATIFDQRHCFFSSTTSLTTHTRIWFNE